MIEIKSLFERYKRIIHSVYSYKRKKIVLNYPPYILWIEPTNHCNLECVMCPTVNTPKDSKGYMELGLFKKMFTVMFLTRISSLAGNLYYTKM